MDSAARIDQFASLAFDSRIRKQSAQDDGANDLFARALDRQLARQHEDGLARNAPGKARQNFAGRFDRARDSGAPGEATPRDERSVGDADKNSDVSRETTEAPAKAKPATPRQDQPKARTASKSGETTAKPAAADAKDAPVDQKAAATTTTATEGDDKPADQTAGKPTAAAKVSADATVSTVGTAAAQPAVDVAVTANAAGAPIGVLLLTGASGTTPNAAAQDAAQDPALASLLAKLPVAQAAAANATDGTTADPASIAPADPLLVGKPKTTGSDGARQPAVTQGPAKARTASGATAAQPDASKTIAPQATPLAALTPANNGAPKNIALGEDIALTGDSSVGDVDISAWPDPLGPALPDGTLARTASMRSAAFLAQLKQNVPSLPPHEQVAVQIQRAARNGIGRLTVDLQPAELGRVEIKMDVDKDKNVTANVVVDRPGTLDLLQRDARNLERLLQEAGLQTNSGSLSFSLRDSGPGNQEQAGGGSASMGGGRGAGGDDAASGPAPVRPDVVATADGYVDLKT
jgi:hypothetical protein